MSPEIGGEHPRESSAILFEMRSDAGRPAPDFFMWGGELPA
jgi:hypothetical protein